MCGVQPKWCLNGNLNIKIVTEFKKLIIEIINKIYKIEEIKQFCSMNKINNFEELFEKYKVFMNNKNKNINYKYDKEIEIKINNKAQETCDC